jgi:Flp pilus assembly protein TadG
VTGLCRRIAAEGAALLKQACRSESGGSLVEVAVMMPVLIFLLIGVVDVSQAYYYSVIVSDAAEAGVLYGISNPSDIAGMRSASALDASGLKGGINSTATYGCECMDGSGGVPLCAAPPLSCSSNYVHYVQVSTSWTYTPIVPYPGLQSSYVLQGLAMMRASQ